MSSCSSEGLLPSVVLADVQKGDLARIWDTYQEAVLSITSTQTSSKLIPHTRDFVARLHAFFLSLMDSTNEKSSGGIIQKVLGKEARLLEGRHNVVTWNHQSFTKELDDFEWKGHTPPDEYVRKYSFAAYLHHRPETAFAAAGCAVVLAVATRWRRTWPPDQQIRQQQTALLAQLQQFLCTSYVIARFTHVRPHVNMMDVKTSMAYKYISIKGQVVKARPKCLAVVSADFMCGKCGAQFSHTFVDGKYTQPTKCLEKCRSRNFTIIRSTATYRNFQQIKLQEAQDESFVHAGRTPRQINVQMTDDLVDCCRAGDVVTVAGVVRAVNAAVAAGRSGRQAQETSTYQLYLQANSVTAITSSSKSVERQETNATTTVSFTPQQLQCIVQLAHADHKYFGMVERRAFSFDLLVKSICPTIVGHNLVKAGILLGLLGGTPSDVISERTNPAQIRSNSHVLLVGDPGMGKSQMLLAASQVAARSVYVGGNTTSATGLTVSLTKEAGGEAGIEAGALVLADRGVCCLDELDKMPKTHQDGLLEAMEQQQISIAKAGVVASLPARCSVIAAANPKHGSYNMTQTVAENLNLSTPILSRFDLVFILRDVPDRCQDRTVSSNIMNLYRGKDSQASKLQPSRVHSEYAESTKRMPLKNRLSWVMEFQQNPIPADLVRDYISYAREYCKPKMTEDAAKVLQDYFMDLRYPPDGANRNDSIPITTRQLEALIRLSQARAKACLREFVLEEDALDVVELMKESVDLVHMDEQGKLDKTRGGAAGKSQRKLKKLFVNELQRLSGEGPVEFSLDDMRRVAAKVDCGLGEFSSMLDDLRNEGILMKRPNGNYKLA